MGTIRFMKRDVSLEQQAREFPKYQNSPILPQMYSVVRGVYHMLEGFLS